MTNIIITFARMNPPTKGHEVVINFMKKLAKQMKCEYRVVLSRKSGDPNNPLDPELKEEYFRELFPKTNYEMTPPEAPTIISYLKNVLQSKYTSIIVVVGGDREKEFSVLLDKYNGKEYTFDTIKVISVGDRDPDSDDVSGISASKLREAAEKNDFETFKKGLPTHVPEVIAQHMFDDVRESLQQIEQINSTASRRKGGSARGQGSFGAPIIGPQTSSISLGMYARRQDGIGMIARNELRKRQTLKSSR